MVILASRASNERKNDQLAGEERRDDRAETRSGKLDSLLIQVMRSRHGVKVSFGEERTVEESSSNLSEGVVMLRLVDEDRLSLIGVVDGFWDVESHLKRSRETRERVSLVSKEEKKRA